MGSRGNRSPRSFRCLRGELTGSRLAGATAAAMRPIRPLRARSESGPPLAGHGPGDSARRTISARAALSADGYGRGRRLMMPPATFRPPSTTLPASMTAPVTGSVPPRGGAWRRPARRLAVGAVFLRARRAARLRAGGGLRARAVRRPLGRGRRRRRLLSPAVDGLAAARLVAAALRRAVAAVAALRAAAPGPRARQVAHHSGIVRTHGQEHTRLSRQQPVLLGRVAWRGLDRHEPLVAPSDAKP